MTLRERTDAVIGVAASLGIATYFWRLVRPSLHLYFSPDDLMNLYRAWDAPLHQLVRDNLLFFLASPFYRPLAEAWYRVVFSFAGFRPLPFHAALLAILFVNIWLTYALARRLSGSRETGTVAALVGCYQVRLAALYFDTGYIFDVLCYCFYFAAFLLYVRVRQQDRLPGIAETAAVWLLYCCALSSKELAVTLPLFLLIYEVLYPGVKWRAAFQQCRVVIVTGLTTAVFLVGRSLGSETLLANAAYRPAFTPQQFLETSRHFLGDMTAVEDRFRAAWVLPVWVVLFAIAWGFRSRTLKFAWLFLMLSPLPVAFIWPRGAAQYYVPWFGWVLYLAALLVGAAAWVTQRFWKEGYWLPRIRGAVLLLVLAAVLYPYYKRLGWQHTALSESFEAPHVAAMVSQLHRLVPVLPRGARLYFRNDPVDPDLYDLLFLVRLSYHDASLTVDRARQMKEPPTKEQLAHYDHVFDYAEGSFFEVGHP